MATTEKALLMDILDFLNGAHQYLSQDLGTERLSAPNQHKRQHYIQAMVGFIQRIQSLQGPPGPPIIQPRMNTPGKIPPQIQRYGGPPPPTFVPPIIPGPKPTVEELEDPQDVYEVPENKQEEPQEDYLAMECEEDRIQEETYEDPTQSKIEESGELYEETLPLSLEPSTPQINVSGPSNTAIQHEPAGYMDPLQLTTDPTTDNRSSMISEDLLGDWEIAYEQSSNKKKEKIKASKLENVIFKGWLEKLGGRNHKTWQGRYCVLAGIFMYFYEKESSSTYNNRIPILGFVPNPADNLTNPKKKHFCFKLSAMNSIGDSKDYYFRSKTEQECTGWIESIGSVAEVGRGIVEKRKSMTLPANSSSLKPTTVAHDSNSMPRFDAIPEQENYEALEPVHVENEPQEDYVDVNVHDTTQEEYVGLTPANIEEEESQDDYIEPQEIHELRPSIPAKSIGIPKSAAKLPLPPPPVQASQLPLPPPPVQASQLPLPPPPVQASQLRLPPPSVQASQLRLPPPPVQEPKVVAPPHRPDPYVDTSKVYEQKVGGIQYNKVYVILWDFQTAEPDELNVHRGDLVLVSDPKTGQEWWYGELLDQNATRKVGPCGLFPSNYSSNAFEIIPS